MADQPTIKLYDFNKKAYEDVPEDQVKPMILSGNYGFEEGAEISVRSPKGDFGTVDPKDVYDAFSKGFDYEPPTMRQARKEKEDFESRTAEAALLGAGRGVSFGLSDQILSKTGTYTPEELKKLKDYNETASTLGEVGGVAASMLVPGAGAANIATKGAKAATVGVRGAAKAAQATEKIVAKALAGKAKSKLAKEIAEKIVPKTAGSMVEGAFYGTGQVISENALGETDLNAENLLAGAGLGALLGGAATGTFSALGKAADPVIDGLSATVNKSKTALGNIIDRAKDPVAGAMATISGKDKKTLNKILQATPEERANLFSLENQREKLRDEMTETLSEMYSKTSDKKMFSAAKSSNVQEALKTVEPSKIVKQSDDVIMTLDEVAEELRLDQLPLANKFTRKVDALKRKFEGFDPDKDTAAELFDHYNTLKREVGDMLPFGKRELSVEEQALLGSGKKAYDKLKMFLEDQDVWGEAGAVQSLLNESSDNLQRATKDFQRYFYNKSKGKIDPVKIKSFLRKANTKEGEDAIEALENYMNASGAYSDALRSVSKYAPDSVELNTKAINSLNSKLGNIRAEGLKKAAEEAELLGLKSREGGELANIFLGSMIDPSMGTLAGVYQAFKDPYRALSVLSKVEQSYLKNTKRIDKAVKGFADKARGKVKDKKIVRPAVTATLLNLNYSGQKRKKSETKEEAFTKVSEDLSELASNPTKLMELVESRTNLLAAEAPETSMYLTEKVGNAVNFLHDKMPKNDAAATSMNPLIRKWKPSKSEIARFDRYVRAIEDPMSVVEDLEDGRVSAESVEALQTVYPRIYNQIVQNITEKSAELQLELPYPQRLQLSTMFGVPLDESLQFVQQFQPQQEQPEEEVGTIQDTAVRPSQSGLKNLSRAEDTAAGTTDALVKGE